MWISKKEYQQALADKSSKIRSLENELSQYKEWYSAEERVNEEFRKENNKLLNTVEKLEEEIESLKKANLPLYTYLVEYSDGSKSRKAKVVATSVEVNVYNNLGLTFYQRDMMVANFTNASSYQIIESEDE